MTDAAPIIATLEALPGAKLRGSEHSVKCPAHDDRVASLTWTTNAEGAVLLKCHAGCDTEAVVGALEHRTADLFEPRDREPKATTMELPRFGGR